jgi:hypothetical protein
MSKWEKIPENVSKNNLLNWASQIPDMLMQDASWHNQAVLQWLSKCDTSWRIDGEIGDLREDTITGDINKKGLLTYLRYNLWLDAPVLKQLMDKDYTSKEVDDLVEMSNAASRFELYEIGKNAAEKGAIIDEIIAATKIKEDHFPPNFNL